MSVNFQTSHVVNTCTQIRGQFGPNVAPQCRIDDFIGLRFTSDDHPDIGLASLDGTHRSGDFYSRLGKAVRSLWIGGRLGPPDGEGEVPGNGEQEFFASWWF